MISSLETRDFETRPSTVSSANVSYLVGISPAYNDCVLVLIVDICRCWHIMNLAMFTWSDADFSNVKSWNLPSLLPSGAGQGWTDVDSTVCLGVIHQWWHLQPFSFFEKTISWGVTSSNTPSCQPSTKCYLWAMATTVLWKFCCGMKRAWMDHIQRVPMISTELEGYLSPNRCSSSLLWSWILIITSTVLFCKPATTKLHTDTQFTSRASTVALWLQLTLSTAFYIEHCICNHSSNESYGCFSK